MSASSAAPRSGTGLRVAPPARAYGRLPGARAGDSPHRGGAAATRTLEAPEEFAVRLSASKAREVSRRVGWRARSSAPIRLWSSTATCWASRVDRAEAVQMLRRLRGRTHRVVTGVTVVDGASGRALSMSRSTDVLMRRYGDDEICGRTSTPGSPFDKAGGYGVQDPVFAPAESVNGCYLNVVGLPLCDTLALLAGMGAEARPRPGLESARGVRRVSPGGRGGGPMTFVGMGPLEILVVLLVAFIVMGPDRMLTAARTIGKVTGELRRLADGLPQISLDEEPTERPIVHRRGGPSSRTGATETPTRPPEDAEDEPEPEPDGPVAFKRSDRTSSDGPDDAETGKAEEDSA